MYLFLSPHLDDATLSCGGFIHHLTSAQKPVTILTVMAGDPPNPLPDTPHVRELHERWQAGESPMPIRRQEDKAAGHLLSAEVIHMDLPDCVYRSAQGIALYPEKDDIFGDVHPSDPAYEALDSKPLPHADEIRHIFVPLGVGHHVDHLLLRDWVLSQAESQPHITVAFFEEYPYCEDQSAVKRALQDHPVPLETDIKLLDAEDFEAKAAAITCYRSQISTFWKDADDMKHHLHRYMTGVGGHQLAERYWYIAR